jgi:hypothetical protein
VHTTAGLNAHLTCAAACRISARLTVSHSTEKHDHLTSTTLAGEHTGLTRAGTKTLKLTFSKTVRRRLRHRTVKATLTVAVTPGVGRSATFTRHVTVKG